MAKMPSLLDLMAADRSRTERTAMREFTRGMTIPAGAGDQPMFVAPMTTSPQPVASPTMSASNATAPAAAPAPAQERGGFLRGFFGPEGRDARARLAIALEGMTMNPNQALVGELQRGIETRASEAQRNKTVEWLRSRGHNDLADALETGSVDAASVINEALSREKPAAPPEIREVDGRLLSISSDGTIRELYAGQGQPADPQSAIAKLEADRRAGLISEEQYQAGMQAIAPQGTVIETLPDGTTRIVQGAGVGRPLTEAQSKFATFQTDMKQASDTLNELEGRYDPTNLQDAASGVLGDKWGSFLQTADGQIYRSAAYQWLDSAIRIRTGAAATNDEINRQYASMFPQPGDLPATVEYKRRARENFMRSVDEALKGVREPLAPPAGTDVFTPSAGAGTPPPVAGGNRIRYDDNGNRIE